MHENDVLVRVANEILSGMITTAQSATLKGIKPAPRRGVCIVERCARLVETACEACREQDCRRCAIAAELRAAEDRINAERDAELAALGLDDQDFDRLVDQFVDNLCAEHVAFGPVLAGEWYGRRSFAVASANG